METSATIHSDFPIPPGEYLEEVLEELGISKTDLANRMGRPATKLSPIFKGQKAITPDTALQLEKVVGVPAQFWINLEAEYRLSLAIQQEEIEQSKLKQEVPLTKKFCYAELSKIGVVPKLTKGIEKVLALQEFFGVTSLQNVKEVSRYAAAFRHGGAKKERSPEAVAAWLRIGELEARKIDCQPFDREHLKDMLSELRAMTGQPPSKYLEPLREKLAAVGVALVICPHLSKTYAQGATFRLGKEKVVLMLTIRGKYADIFWFSLFHELGHILKHNQNSLFVNYYGDDEKQVYEQEADDFASDTLIPNTRWHAFIAKGKFYKDDILHFSRNVEIHPGIVVGRLQHEKYLHPSWRNNLRVKYEWPKK